MNTTFLDFFGVSDLNRIVNISYRHRFIYFDVHNPGSAEILEALRPFEVQGISEPEPKAAASVVRSPFVKPFQLTERQLLDTLSDRRFFTFAFVTDPFERARHAFASTMRHAKVPRRMILRRLGIKPGTADPDISLEQFFDAVSALRDLRRHRFLMAQHYQSFAAFMDLDFVGRIENVEADMRTVSGRLGMQSEARGRRRMPSRSTGAGGPAMSEAARLRILDVYRRDFEAFHYPAMP